MFSFTIACYLFLGGLGGGLCVVTAVAGLRIPREYLAQPLPEQCSVLSRNFSIAAAVLLLSALCLLADSISFRALPYLFLAPRVSFLSVGAWAIAACMVLCGILAFLWHEGSGALRQGQHTVWRVRVMRALLVVSVLVGFAVALYTGLFLASMRAVPLWNTPWLPVLFVLSALSCGLVAFITTVHVSGMTKAFSSYVHRLVKLDITVIALELFCASGLILTLLLMQDAGPTAEAGRLSVLALLAGDYAWMWWGGFVVCGLLIAALFDVVILRSSGSVAPYSYVVLFSALCVSVGAFALRACFIVAGAHPVLSF